MQQNPYEDTGKNGKGELFYYGVNQAADVAIIFKKNILLIQRKDDKKWALPGGFKESQESTRKTASRELYEETGIYVDSSKLDFLFHTYVKDDRNTNSAWIETDVYMHKLFCLPKLKPNNEEVIACKFVNKTEIIDYTFHANHKEIIRKILIN